MSRHFSGLQPALMAKIFFLFFFLGWYACSGFTPEEELARIHGAMPAKAIRTIGTRGKCWKRVKCRHGAYWDIAACNSAGTVLSLWAITLTLAFIRTGLRPTEKKHMKDKIFHTLPAKMDRKELFGAVAQKRA